MERKDGFMTRSPVRHQVAVAWLRIRLWQGWSGSGGEDVPASS